MLAIFPLLIVGILIGSVSSVVLTILIHYMPVLFGLSELSDAVLEESNSDIVSLLYLSMFGILFMAFQWTKRSLYGSRVPQIRIASAVLIGVVVTIFIVVAATATSIAFEAGNLVSAGRSPDMFSAISLLLPDLTAHPTGSNILAFITGSVKSNPLLFATSFIACFSLSWTAKPRWLTNTVRWLGEFGAVECVEMKDAKSSWSNIGNGQFHCDGPMRDWIQDFQSWFAVDSSGSQSADFGAYLSTITSTYATRAKGNWLASSSAIDRTRAQHLDSFVSTAPDGNVSLRLLDLVAYLADNISTANKKAWESDCRARTKSILKLT